MFNLDALKQLDLGRLNPADIDLTRFDIRNIEIPKVDLPKVDLPKIDLPKIDLPKIDLQAEADRVVAIARDAAYVGVGAVVVVAQAADAQRKAVTDQLTTQVRKVVDAVA